MLNKVNKVRLALPPPGRVRLGWACHSLVALSSRFLAELATLWNRPIHPICHWLWCYVSPVVLLVLFIATLSFLFLKTFTYVAWDASTVSLPLQTPDLPREWGPDLPIHS